MLTLTFRHIYMSLVMYAVVHSEW